MLPHKNRSLEVDNPKAQSAFAEGKVYFRKKDYRNAHSCFMVASAAGHSKISYWLARTTKLLQLDQDIDPESYDRNLEETNRPTEMPKIARSLPFEKEDKAMLMEIPHRTQRPRLSAVEKSPVAQPRPTASQEQDKKQWYIKLKKEAAEGNPEAQYELGIYYLKKAKKWLKKAAEQHYEKAERKLSTLSKTAGEPPQAIAELEQVPSAIPQTLGSGAIGAPIEPLVYEYSPVLQPEKAPELTFRDKCKLVFQRFLRSIRRKNRK